jgi:hypothetical protein
MTWVRYAQQRCKLQRLDWRQLDIQIMIHIHRNLFRLSDIRLSDSPTRKCFLLDGQVRPRSGCQVAEGQRKLGEKPRDPEFPTTSRLGWLGSRLLAPLVLPRIVLVDRKGPQCGRSESICVHRLDQPSSRGPGERLLTDLVEAVVLFFHGPSVAWSPGLSGPQVLFCPVQSVDHPVCHAPQR